MRRLSLITSLLVICLALTGCPPEGEGTTGPGQVVTVRVTPETRQIATTETATFMAEALDANGNVLGGKTFTFSSSDPAVATIENPTANPVTVTAVGDGFARITATSEGKSGEATLTVEGEADIQVMGRVVDGATGLGIAAATVEFTYVAVNLVTGTTVTGGDGSFSFAVPTTGGVFGEGVELTAEKTGYVSTSTNAVVYAPSTQIQSILLVQQTSVKGSISGTVRNARTNAGIPGVQVELFKDQWTRGNPVATRTSDSNGGFSFTQLDAGTYTLAASGQLGFQFGTRTAITIVSGALVSQDLVLSPDADNLITIVLTWGANPSDLDSHLTGPNTDASRFHVYYANRGTVTASLDVDDTSSFGPETITITQFNSGVYRYSVHDFTNRNSASSSALGASGARVALYTPSSPGSERSFFVPNQPGTLWTVFELSGSIANPTITVRNQMGLASDAGSILSPPSDNSTGPAEGGIVLFRDRLARYGRVGDTDAGPIGRTIRTLPKALQR